MGCSFFHLLLFTKPCLPGLGTHLPFTIFHLGGLTLPPREHMTRPGQSEHQLPLATPTGSGTGHMIPAQPMGVFLGICVETTGKGPLLLLRLWCQGSHVPGAARGHLFHQTTQSCLKLKPELRRAEPRGGERQTDS